MKQRTVRLILDCMMCDAMTPEFKAANAILLSIIRANDKSDAISHTMLAAVGKAFKENDARKSREALARITADVSRREKALNDALVEARTKLAETTKRNTDAKTVIAQIRKDMGLFDKFVAAANAVKTTPKGLSKLSMYDLKLKKYGDFAKHIARINQLVSAKKDHAKATDALVKAIEKAKEKAKKDTAKAEKELKESSERVKAWKDMEKMRARNIELFRKQQDDLRKMAAAIPDEQSSVENEQSSANEKTKEKRTTASFITGESRKIGYGAYLSNNEFGKVVELKPGVPWPRILDKGVWMEEPGAGCDVYIPEGDPKFRPEGARAYIVWGHRKKTLQ